MANEYINLCSTIFVIREIQIKPSEIIFYPCLICKKKKSYTLDSTKYLVKIQAIHKLLINLFRGVWQYPAEWTVRLPCSPTTRL